MLVIINKDFWNRHPAFYFGLILFLGALFALQTPWALFPFFLLLCKRHFFVGVVLFLLPSCWIYQRYTFPPSNSSVEGTFRITSLAEADRYGQGWLYRGELNMRGKKIFCSTYSKKYYSPNSTYRMKGTLRPNRAGHYKIKTIDEWVSVKKRVTPAAWRWQAKKRVKRYIQRHFPHERSALFIAGMTTGELEDRLLKKEFADLGLSHLMAISGLHFSLIGLAFHLLLRLILPHRREVLCLMAGLTLYLFFIGDTPSVIRAWIGTMVFLSGKLLKRRPSALNSLGLALIISLLWNPMSAITLSFQLSFLATAGILFFYIPCTKLVGMWLPQRKLADVCRQSFIWQHGYLFTSFVRDAVALSLAVHLTLLPLLLTAFHSFPWNSLFYNLFFPFLASIALLLFLAGLPFGGWVHAMNDWYCELILRIPHSPPLFIEPLYIKEVPTWVLTTAMTLLLGVAVACKIKKSGDGFGISDHPVFNHL